MNYKDVEDSIYIISKYGGIENQEELEDAVEDFTEDIATRDYQLGVFQRPEVMRNYAHLLKCGLTKGIYLLYAQVIDGLLMDKICPQCGLPRIRKR